MSLTGTARRRAVLGVAASVLTGCGFRPAYMKSSAGPGAQADLAAVHVQNIFDRPGQLLRQALQERLERGATGVARRYDLSVNYGISGEGLAIDQNNNTTRLRFVGRADWTLTAQDPKRTPLTSGQARSFDAINLLNQQYFASDLETEVVQRRIAEAVADQITIQLAGYFTRQMHASG